MELKMGWKSSLTIHLGFWFYLVGGGVVYYFIENPGYIQPVEKLTVINDSFCIHLMNSVEYYATINDSDVHHLELNSTSFDMWFDMINTTCNNIILNVENDNAPAPLAWEFSSALFLCMTMLTTIGYGDFSPKSDWGKVFCIFYGFIGIPICGVFIASTSDYFSTMFLYLYEHRKKKEKNDKRRSIFFAAILFLIPGLAVFFFFPAAIFSIIEGWSYLDATYFSFLTLATVGFGDIVAAQQTDCPLLWLYRISWIIWVTLGIAYWAIIINFITKALKSKKLRGKWMKTSLSLSSQAQEMRRVVKRQLSSNDVTRKNENLFIALKTKPAFDFAFQIAGSLGKAAIQRPRRLSLSEILTAFESSAPNRGLSIEQSVMDQSASDFTEDEVNNRPTIQESYDSSSDPPSTSDDQPVQPVSKDLNDCVSTNSIFMSLSSTRKTSANSGDIPFPGSWFDDDQSIHSIYLSLNPSRKTSENSGIYSYPGRRKSSTEDLGFRDLLIEAIMILNEAELDGTELDK